MFKPLSAMNHIKESHRARERAALSAGRALGVFCLALMMTFLLSAGGQGHAVAQNLVESVNLSKAKSKKKVKRFRKLKKAKKVKSKKIRRVKAKVKRAKVKKTKVKAAAHKNIKRPKVKTARRIRALRKAKIQKSLRVQRRVRSAVRQRKAARQKKNIKVGQGARTGNRSVSLASRVRAQAAFKASLNQNTVTLMSGCCTTGAYTAFGADIKDMVARIDRKNGLRVLPVLGGGAGTNIRDLLYLRGVDLAIINTDVIDYFQGQPLYENLTGRIRYITKLFNEEVHFYAGSSVSALADLQGKTVGFNNSNAEVTALILFEKLGIEPAKTLRISEADGALALKEGRIDAMFRVTGKPIRNVARLKAIFPQIRLLPIHYDPAIVGSHLPTRLTHADYPELIAKGQVVPTVATRTILAVFNWKPGSSRYRRLEKFVKLFFDNYTGLRASKNLHPKWAEVNLQANVPGLKRFAPVQTWLNKRARPVADLAEKTSIAPENKRKSSELMKNFKEFMAGRNQQGIGTIKKSDSDQLIADFLRWKKQQR